MTKANRLYILRLVAVLSSALLSSHPFACYAQVNPYISRVYEYRPAPGQFINSDFPTYIDGDNVESILRRVDSTLCGKPNGMRMICLGAWGGYVVFGFDHPVVNVLDQADLKIYGNAFYRNGENPEGYTLGSSEPGVVYVSRDENGNGLPDDTWYEIAGSAHAEADRHYERTYRRVGRAPVPWTDNMGQSGVIARNQWHTQASYYPLWLTDETLTFTGTLLPDNLYEENTAYMYDYGYVDNRPNEEEGSNIRLDWAIDAEGNPVWLSQIDFVKVQTAVAWQGSLTGEASTEVCGAEDLHPEAVPSALETIHDDRTNGGWQKRIVNGRLVIINKITNKYYNL